MGERVPVSCYIRTLNEERKLGAVIAAVRDFVSEVVVVDSGSTDATVAIAQAHGARVIHQEWLGNGRQKRFAEDQCRHDFLLDLDADEVVSPALAVEIRTLFAQGPPPRPIYELKLVTVPPFGDPWHFAVARRRKLYNRRVVRAPDHKAWDQFRVPPGVEVGRLQAPVFHYAFRDLAHVVAKLNRASTVRARETRSRRGRVAVGARVLFAFPVYFIKHYLLRGLFRAGIYGVSLAGILAYGRWLRDVKMYERILASRAPSSEETATVEPSGEELKPRRETLIVGRLRQTHYQP